jgi:hypothetical protein
MGVSYSRKIYDPENRSMDMKEIAKKYKVIISDWYRDEEERMICDETTELSHEIIRVNYKEMYEILKSLGLKGIDKKNKVYDFTEKW